MSVLGQLPEGVDSAMFLRDGWPYAVVCKVLMKDGCVGIGLVRVPGGLRPEQMDQLAMLDAIRNVANEPPDYAEIREYLQRRVADVQMQQEPEIDDDLQASLGQKAHD